MKKLQGEPVTQIMQRSKDALIALIQDAPPDADIVLIYDAPCKDDNWTHFGIFCTETTDDDMVSCVVSGAYSRLPEV